MCGPHGHNASNLARRLGLDAEKGRPVNTLDVAIQLNAKGRFTEALKALDDEEHGSASRGEREVLRAELLERVGRFGQARAVLQRLSKSRVLSAGERSSAEFVLGKIDWEEG